MHPVLRLYEDVLSTAETIPFRLPPLPRFIFVTHGSAAIAGAGSQSAESQRRTRARISVSSAAPNPSQVMTTAQEVRCTTSTVP